MSNWKEAKKLRVAFSYERIKNLLLIGVLGVLLFSVAYSVFHGEEETQAVANTGMSELERKVSNILQEIDGVGEASVIVCEEEESVKSVVVVCEGANNLRVIMDVREAVAAALNTEQKLVKIYLKKDRRR